METEHQCDLRTIHLYWVKKKVTWDSKPPVAEIFVHENKRMIFAVFSPSCTPITTYLPHYYGDKTYVSFATRGHKRCQWIPIITSLPPHIMSKPELTSSKDPSATAETGMRHRLVAKANSKTIQHGLLRYDILIKCQFLIHLPFLLQ